MKKRSTEILQTLIDNKTEQYSLSGLASSFQVTQKTMRNDLAEINDFLDEIGFSQITLDHDGILKMEDDFDARVIGKKLCEMDIYQYRLSPEERRIYILAVLLHDSGYIIMRKLADEMYVTRITILNDFDKIREELAEIGITLTSDSGKGVYLDCDNAQRIQLLLDIFNNISVSTRNMGFFQRLVLNKLDLEYSFNEIFSLIQKYMYEQHLVLIDDICYDIALYLYAAFNLVYLNHDDSEQSTEDPYINPNDCDHMDQMMLYISQKLSVPVSPEMLNDFRAYRMDKDLNSYIRNVDDLELYEVVTRFLSTMDNELGLELSDDSLLIDSLVLHIRNLKGWNDEDIQLPKSSRYDIDYDTLMYTVEDYSYIIEKYLGYDLSDNMKKSIVIHICVSLIRCNQNASRLSVLIVCPGSMATGKYLETQIRNYFDFHIIDVVAASILPQRLQEIDHVDFILSTVNIQVDSCPVLQVHPVLTMEDMNLIQKKTFSCNRNQSKKIVTIKPAYKSIQNLKNMIEDGRFTEEMYLQVKELLELYEYQKSHRLTAIGSLLEKNQIIIDSQTLYPDWRSAIAAAGKILLDLDYVTIEYVEQAIHNIEQYGDYIIIGRGTALAHARKEFGALKNGLSLIVSKEGILFSDGETKVHFLFFYSTIEETTDVKLFREIVSIGRNKERSEQLLSMERDELSNRGRDL